MGSYGCTCKDGYTGNGFVCASKEVIDKRELKMNHTDGYITFLWVAVISVIS